MVKYFSTIKSISDKVNKIESNRKLHQIINQMTSIFDLFTNNKDILKLKYQ